MDVLYKPEDLLTLRTPDVPKDERYLLIKSENQIGQQKIINVNVFSSFIEAVQHKFCLSTEELETMWLWLHSVFLAKRRTIHAKMKRLPNEN